MDGCSFPLSAFSRGWNWLSSLPVATDLRYKVTSTSIAETANLIFSRIQTNFHGGRKLFLENGANKRQRQRISSSSAAPGRPNRPHRIAHHSLFCLSPNLPTFFFNLFLLWPLLQNPTTIVCFRCFLPFVFWSPFLQPKLLILSPKIFPFSMGLPNTVLFEELCSRNIPPTTARTPNPSPFHHSSL